MAFGLFFVLIYLMVSRGVSIWDEDEGSSQPHLKKVGKALPYAGGEEYFGEELLDNE